MGYLVIMLDPTLGLGLYGEMVRTCFLMLELLTKSAPQHNVKTEKMLLRHEKEKNPRI